MEQWKEDLLILPGRPEETDWLRARLEVAGRKEEIALAAAVQRNQPETVAGVVDCILSVPNHEVLVGIDSFEALGRYALADHSPAKSLDDVLPFVDLERLGEKYEDIHPGLFIGDCYVVYPERAAGTSQYDGVHLPAEDYSWSLRLKLASPSMPEGVWIVLPDFKEITEESPGEISLALGELGVKTIQECTLLDARCVLPGISGLMDYDDLTDLIYDGQNLGLILDEQNQGQPNFLEHYLAALEWEGCSNLKSALDISQNLKCYDFVSASGLAQYGKDALQKEMGWKDGTMLDDCIDFEGYARQALERKGAEPLLDGRVYVARNNHTFVTEFVQPPSGMIMQ